MVANPKPFFRLCVSAFEATVVGVARHTKYTKGATHNVIIIKYNLNSKKKLLYFYLHHLCIRKLFIVAGHWRFIYPENELTNKDELKKYSHRQLMNI